ncbi:MAG: hypothetical protein ACYS32_02735 [Planctomycetota bacterium]|jgi:hypothetical protein
MFKQSTMQAIAMVTVVAVALYATGITEAAATPVVAQTSSPIVPLTDNDLANIEGGGWLIALTAILVVVAVCTLVVTVMEKDEPQVSEPIIIYDGPGDDHYEFNNTTVILHGEGTETTCPTCFDPVVEDHKVDGPCCCACGPSCHEEP